MKNSDIAMIILVASISVVVSYFLGNAILGDPNDRVEKLSYMNPIDNNIQEPDAETFNPYALNPTVEVYVGNCGPLETWNETKHVCVPKDGVESSVENNDDNDDNDGSNSDAADTSGEDEESTDTGDDGSLSGDE